MHDTSIEHLTSVDPVLARVIARVGACGLTARAEGTHFDALVRSIIYQQLSGKAAATIHARVQALFGNRAPTPVELLATSDESLRAAGLSRQKLSYLKDFAAKVESGVVTLDDTAIDSLTDDEIIQRLIQVKGIGRWTVQMFLMFRLGRPDVLPELDLGVQNAIRRAYELRKHPTPKDVRRIGARWTPHSSVASWYLWRSLEVVDEMAPVARRAPKSKTASSKRSANKKTVKTKRAVKKRAVKKRAVKKRAVKKQAVKVAQAKKKASTKRRSTR